MAVLGWLIEARESLGFSQGELATRLGVTQASVSRWEAGSRAVPAEVRELVAGLATVARQGRRSDLVAEEQARIQRGVAAARAAHPRLARVCPREECNWRSFGDPSAKCPAHGQGVEQPDRGYDVAGSIAAARVAARG